MKKYIFSALILLVPLFSQAQINKNGLPFIKQYTEQEDYGDASQIWAITQDSRDIMYFGCNYGLKTFDGRNWKSYNVPTSTIIRSLAAHDDGMVFYGAESDFGAIISKNGELEFYSFFLNKYKDTKQDFGSVWRTLICDNKVYFQALEKIYYCDLPIRIGKNDSLLNDLKSIAPETLYHLTFSVNDKFYIREWEIGLQEFKNGKKELIPGGEIFALTRLYIMLPIDEKRILLGTRQSGFYIYDTSKKENAISQLELSDQELINNSVLYDATLQADGTIAIATFNNGVIVINKNGQILNQLNTEFGLPDNNVLSIFKNRKKNNAPLWFATDKGIFKAHTYAPFTRWNELTGISGAALNAIRHKGVLYVATSQGLFYLDESELIPKFKNITYEIDCWKLINFKVPNSDEEILLMGSSLGISSVTDNKVTKLGETANAKELYQSKKNPENLYVGSNSGLSMLSFKNNKWSDLMIYDKTPIPEVVSITEFKDYIALGTATVGIILLNDIESDKITLIDSARGLPLVGQDFFLHKIGDKTIVASGGGLYSLVDTAKVEPFESFGKMYSNETKGVYIFMRDENVFWMSTYETNTENSNHELIRIFDNKNTEKDTVFSKMLPQNSTYLLYPDNNKVWIGNDKGLFLFNKEIEKNYKEAYNIIISKVTTKNDSVLYAGTFINGSNEMFVEKTEEEKELEGKIPTLKYKNNELLFEWASPYFEKEEDIQYSYRLLGETETWSKWDTKNERRYTNIYEGDYIFEVKAKNIYNAESYVAQFEFKVLPPWYRTIWALISYVLLAVFFIFIIIKLYTKRLKRENEKLEQIVKERTAEIRMQNEEIKAQRDEIQAQKEEVEKAKDKIERQQQSIMDSIHYASRIQEAVLPPDEFLQDILGEHFVLFRPRDIVSGDFYWATQRGNKTVIVAADCTGHGVPGAFMSMLGISFLNEIVNKEEVLQANIILNRLRQNVKKSLRQTGKDNEAKDGMDIAICIIDMDEMKLQFAGAYNPLYILRNGEISRVKADRMPIGIYLREKESFTNNLIDIKKGDFLYIFSDGYVDQFGGPTDDKIKSEKFKSLLLENHQKSPDEQKAELVKYLESWMAFKDKTGRTYKQVDDILVIGIEI